MLRKMSVPFRTWGHASVRLPSSLRTGAVSHEFVFRQGKTFCDIQVSAGVLSRIHYRRMDRQTTAY